MRRILVIISLFAFLLSCAVNKTRNKVYDTTISFKSGVFENKSWDESLEFNRVSWFNDATVNYEIIIAKLTKDSPFASWMGSEKLMLTSCENFYVTAIYTDINSHHTTSYLVDQMTRNGLSEVNILDFSYQLKAHQNFQDWKLGRHKVLGFCEKTKQNKDILISIPGFKSYKLL